MPNVDLDLQMKFLTDLDRALNEALGNSVKYEAEKLAELEYMKKEVARARSVVQRRMESEDDRSLLNMHSENGLHRAAAI